MRVSEKKSVGKIPNKNIVVPKEDIIELYSFIHTNGLRREAKMVLKAISSEITYLSKKESRRSRIIH